MSSPIEASKIEPENVEFLWNDRIAKGMISIIAGKPDQGKGLAGAHIAAVVSRAGGRVLFSAAEDSHSLMTAPRLQAAGAVMKNVLLWRFALPTQLVELEQVIRKGTPDSPGPIDLVVMDPFNAHLSGVTRFSEALREKVLIPLTKIIESTNAALVVIEHVVKRVPKGSDPLSAIGGSGSGLPAASRAAYLFGKDPDDDEQRILACVKFNIGMRPEPFCFQIDTDDLDNVSDVPLLVPVGETVIDPIRLINSESKDGDARIGRPADKRQEAAEWLTRKLADHGAPMKAGLIQEDAKIAGITSKTLRNAASDMEIVKNPVGGGKNCTWDLPQDIKDTLAADAPDADADAPQTAQDAASVDPASDSTDDSQTITDADLAALLGSDANADADAV